MYPGELPYRLGSVVRALVQYAGFMTAKSVLAADVRRPFSTPWVFAPTSLLELPIGLKQRADTLMRGDLRIFGKTLTLANGTPEWNRDPITGHPIPLGFGLFLDFRHMAGGVDIKFLWEINRHCWWVTLAQAFAITRNLVYLDRLKELLRSWLDQCPYPLGPNWSSPVENAIRLLNWSIVWHLTGGPNSELFSGLPGKQLRDEWLRSIYQHMHFVSDNYSLYSSADNHLIGEAAGVYIGATTWNYWARCDDWQKHSKALLEAEALKQFSPDGVNREHAICYHKFSLEFLLAAGLCARASGDDFSRTYWQRIAAALTFLAAMTMPDGTVPAIGDSDDGRVFNLGYEEDPSGYRSLVVLGGVLLGRRDLIAKVAKFDSQVAWLCQGMDSGLQGPSSDHFKELPQDFGSGGYIILGTNLHTSNETRVVFNTGELGYNKVAGHGHSDALAVYVSHRGIPLLVDSGTYSYNTAPTFRKYFRGTSAHNTVMVDGLDQANYGGPFLWLSDIHCSIEHKLLSEKEDRVRASHDGYMRLRDPVRHIRDVRLDKYSFLLEVEDRLECGTTHFVDVLWHCHPDCLVNVLGNRVVIQSREVSLVLRCSNNRFSIGAVTAQEHPPLGWISERFYEKRPTTTIMLRGSLNANESVRTLMEFGIRK